MSNPIDNIRTYSLEARGSPAQDMEIDGSDAKTEARLEQTIKELQERLRARRLELEKVGSHPSLVAVYTFVREKSLASVPYQGDLILAL